MSRYLLWMGCATLLIGGAIVVFRVDERCLPLLWCMFVGWFFGLVALVAKRKPDRKPAAASAEEARG